MDKGAGDLPPFFVGHGHHCRLRHSRVSVQHLLHFQTGDVFAAGDNHVLGPVADFDIVIRMHNGEVSCVEPAVAERLFGGFLILQVPLHHRVAADTDLAHDISVSRYCFSADHIQHCDFIQAVHGNALAGHFFRPILQWQLLPFRLGHTQCRRAERFGQAIQVSNLEANLLCLADNTAGGRCATESKSGGPGQCQARPSQILYQQVHHHRRPTHVGDTVVFDASVDLLTVHLPKTHMSTPDGGDCPGIGPAIAMEHRQCPQVDGLGRHVESHGVGHGRKIGTAMVVNHTFWIAGGSRGVIQGNGVPLVCRMLPASLGIAFLQQGFVIKIRQPLALPGLAIDGHQQGIHLKLGYSGPYLLFPLGVVEQNPGLTMSQDKRQSPGIQTDVDGVKYPSGHRHGVMGLKHFVGVRTQNGYRVARLDTAAAQGTRHLAAASVKPPVRQVHIVVNHRQFFRVHPSRPLQQRERSEWRIVCGGLVQFLVLVHVAPISNRPVLPGLFQVARIVYFQPCLRHSAKNRSQLTVTAVESALTKHPGQGLFTLP
ncbi:hypothetical protein MDG893_07700 [Marinobacter algicola DG893]|uniref:Uncharacterized protein n=1 Tax=Marinobacter algicola DG893 TaxID=443152 RepID=A6EW77_9GAMM|nr:hypothetical protein MDG893_07700 [Marinobacter algicola DG893]